MGYKDKDKQREANKRASQRRRDKQKGMTQNTETQGMTHAENPAAVIPNFGQPDCECMHCRQVRVNNITYGRKHKLNHGPYKKEEQLEDNEFNRVPLPGDPDYTGAGLHPKYNSRRGIDPAHVHIEARTKATG